MRRYWDSFFGLDYERSIWIEEKELGKEKLINVNHRRLIVRLPQNINKDVILRLRGRGKTRKNTSGDLLLHIWLNKGDDIRTSLWVSESSARNGADKLLFLDEKTITMVIPPKSYDGLTIRLKGQGEKMDFTWRAPFLDRKRGNVLVRLFVYPDKIMPRYGSFDLLSTEDMALEGWVYQKIDEVIRKLGKPSFPASPIQVDAVVDVFNERGWRGIYHALVDHLKLAHLKIELTKSKTISLPGSCQRIVTYQPNTPLKNNYVITINETFLDNPFSTAAILAHELCHVIHSERIGDTSTTVGTKIKPDKATLEDERTVDLLSFMFKIGEFQLRVARDKRFTLGYFDQDLFERMQGIVSRKLNK
jgi:hypothetical protein